jgi:hypothetical protein
MNDGSHDIPKLNLIDAQSFPLEPVKIPCEINKNLAFCYYLFPENVYIAILILYKNMKSNDKN